MVNKAGQIIRFASRGVYESVEGYGCTKCVAFGAGQVTNLCQAICKLANCAGFHWKELDSSNKPAPEPLTAKTGTLRLVTEDELKAANKLAALMRETASSQHYISTGAAEALRGGSVYTIYFQHIPTGASLHIECPAISVAQDLWDLLANHPGFKLQCLRP